MNGCQQCPNLMCGFSVRFKGSSVDYILHLKINISYLCDSIKPSVVILKFFADLQTQPYPLAPSD